jgi:hypothetical protein
MTTPSRERRIGWAPAACAIWVALWVATGAWPVAAQHSTAVRPASSVRAQTTPTPRTHTGPGLGTKAGKDAVSSRAVRGLVFIVIALAVVGVLFRVRVRDWMLGRYGRASNPGSGLEGDHRSGRDDRGPDA